MDTEAGRQTGDKLILILSFTLVISVMNGTMFNIVLSQIATEFDLTFSQVSWVSSAFLLVYAIGTMIYGKLADTYKLKSLLTFGLIFFAAGSMIGLVSNAYWMVLLGRILQAAGSAVIPATAGIIPVRYFPPERRGRALGIAMTGLAIGSAIGPAVAALVVSTVHWRWLFCMPLFMLLTLPYYRKYLNDERSQGSPIDWIGGGLLALTVALLLLAITYAAWLPALGCAALFAAFLARIRAAKSPFVRPDLFRNKSYSLGLPISFLGTCIGYVLPFLSPQLLSQVNHLSSVWVGVSLIPAAVATALLGRKAGQLADAKGNPFLFFTSTALLGLCLLLLSSFAGSAPILISLILIFGNVGLSFMSIAMSNAISRSLPQEHTGVGMGLLSMLGFIGGTLSASLYSSFIERGASTGWNPVNVSPEAFAYSNLYLALAVLLGIIAAVYSFQFETTLQRESNNPLKG